MDVKDLCSTTKSRETFYPTPEEMAIRMLDKIDFRRVYSVLEPSAGKGDLLMEILKRMNRKFQNYDTSAWWIDTIEIDPNLRSILSHRFTDAGIREYAPELFQKLDQMEYHRREVLNNPESTKEYYDLQEKAKEMGNPSNVRIMHDDFLTYSPQFGYDAIIMNPPLDQGARHLLHAIQLTMHYGGQIVCLLHAEVLQNLDSQESRDLMRKLDEYDADIEFIPHAFYNAERETDVDIDLVYLNIRRERLKSKIFDHLEKAQQIRQERDPEYAELLSTDPIEAAIAMYNMEVTASLSLIDEYWAMSDYLNQKFDGKNEQILSLCIMKNGQKCDLDIDSYMHSVRLKYWKSLLNNKQFIGLLTSNLRSKYQKMIHDLANYEFSRYNIEKIRREMMAELLDGAKACIMELFDKLTAMHCYNDSVQNGNIHYYNGWKTNKAYKLDKKCIIPTYGLYSEWSNEFNYYAALSLLSDMEKALNYLDGGLTQEVNLEENLKDAIDSGKTRNIHLKYFDISLYKKGTAHIVFRDPALIDHFNIYASQQRGWLPPSYGKKGYDDMTPEEQAVVDSFQGKDTYQKVMEQPTKYLFSESRMLSLPT